MEKKRDGEKNAASESSSPFFRQGRSPRTKSGTVLKKNPITNQVSGCLMGFSAPTINLVSALNGTAAMAVSGAC